jgi:hypothetical protein
MSEAPKEKIQDPTEWGAYFKNEFKKLKIRRGFNQLERLEPDEIHVLIGEMVLECKKYDEINDKAAIQRVITDAVMTDPDFIGFNVSWVRKTLFKWWQRDGWAKLEKVRKAREEEEEKKKPKPQLNPHENIHETVTNYWKRLFVEADQEKRKTPKMKKEVAEKEGAEWQSELERKAVSKGYSNGYTPEYVSMRDKIQRAGSEFYKNRTSYSDLKLFHVNDFEVFAATEQDAIEIYTRAQKI